MLQRTPTYLDALRQLPLVTAATALRGRKLLVIAPHPDDESLGAGGLIAATTALGHDVTVIFLTDGEGSHVGSPTYPPEALGRLRRSEAITALKALGMDGTTVAFFGLPDGGLSSMPPEEAVNVVEDLARFMTGHTVVCVTSRTDSHPDHQVAHRWAKIASVMTHSELWSYVVWTWVSEDEASSWQPPQGIRIDIGPYLDAKRKAIAAHQSQHGSIVTDAAESFALPKELLLAAEQPFEVYLTSHHT
jgi:LmbE family N-acetylglucosaminyl deacetylase